MAQPLFAGPRPSRPVSAATTYEPASEGSSTTAASERTPESPEDGVVTDTLAPDPWNVRT